MDDFIRAVAADNACGSSPCLAPIASRKAVRPVRIILETIGKARKLRGRGRRPERVSFAKA